MTAAATRRRPGVRGPCAAALLLWAATAAADPALPPSPRFAHLTPREGLSQVSVQCMLQDSTGYMWLGTQDGLNRFDGHEVRVFRSDPSDPEALSDPNIAGLYEDAAGSIWVITIEPGVLHRYDPVRDRFQRFVHDPDDPATPVPGIVNPATVGELEDGTVWLPTFDRGITTVAPDGTVRRLQHDPADPGSLAADGVWATHRDRTGTMWVGTVGGGLDRWEPDGTGGGRFVHHRHVADDPGSLSNDHVTAIFEDHVGTLWVGTLKGLDVLDRKRGLFHRFPSAQAHGIGWEEVAVQPGHHQVAEDGRGALWVVTGAALLEIAPGRDSVTVHAPDAASGLPDVPVAALLADRRGVLWIATAGEGLLRFDPSTGRRAQFRHDPQDPGSLPSDSVMVLAEDRSGVLWVAGDAGGVSRLSSHRNQFGLVAPRVGEPDGLADRFVYALHVDRDGTLWVGTMRGGLHRFDAEGRRVVERYAHLPGSGRDLGGSWVRSVLEDSRGRFWVATADGGGVSLLDRDAGRVVQRYRHDARDPRTLSSNAVMHLFEDRSGRIWAGTGDGWNLLDPETGRCRRYVHRPGEPGSIPAGMVRFTFQDAAGTLWLGTLRGLVRFDEAADRFTTFHRVLGDPRTLASDNIMAVHETADGAFWVATFGGGLCRLDPDSGRADCRTTRTGFPSDALYSVVEATDGALWCSSNHGLIRFDPNAGASRVFGVADGLQDSEFSGRSFLRTADGELLFGGINGFNRFRPEQLLTSASVPDVVLTSITRAGHPLPLDRAPDHLARLVLRHTDRYLALRFAALDFDRPEGVRYAYRLEGLDDQWVELGGEREAHLTNLPGGRYTFRVKAANADGVWNEDALALEVVMVPPPWKRPWAYALYGLALIGGMLGFVHVRTTAHRTAMEHRRKTEELERARTLQLSLLPPAPPHHPELDIAVHMDTATEVGGDYYDFFPQPDGSLYLVVGDATGHGLAAGMMVAMTKASLRAIDAAGPDRLLTRMDDVLRSVELHRLRMALCVVHLDRGAVRLASAAMPPPLLYRARSRTVAELLSPGLPLGGAGHGEYRLLTAGLEPGDSLVLVSDGLPEWPDRGGEPLGYEAVRRAVAGEGHRSPRELLEALLETGRRHGDGRPHQDDVTVLVVRRRAV